MDDSAVSRSRLKTPDTLQSVKRNVGLLSKNIPVTLGQKMKQMAAELGVSVKTLWGWETDRWQPTVAFSELGRRSDCGIEK
jgi:DNA-binding transcriptional regulator YiaG